MGDIRWCSYILVVSDILFWPMYCKHTDQMVQNCVSIVIIWWCSNTRDKYKNIAHLYAVLNSALFQFKKELFEDEDMVQSSHFPGQVTTILAESQEFMRKLEVCLSFSFLVQCPTVIDFNDFRVELSHICHALCRTSAEQDRTMYGGFVSWLI